MTDKTKPINEACGEVLGEKGQHRLTVSVGQSSDRGVKEENEDCMGVQQADAEDLSTKGIVAIVADGVSAASGGKIAAETCVRGFLGDYLSTPDSWSIMTSAQRVLDGLNKWLYSQGRAQGLKDEKGYLSTMSMVILCSRMAHLFNIGDTRMTPMRAVGS